MIQSGWVGRQNGRKLWSRGGCIYKIEIPIYRFFGIFSSVFGIFVISVRYSVSVFWNTSAFGIGIYEIQVENRKFLVPHLDLAPPVECDPVEISQSSPLLENYNDGATRRWKSLIVSLAASIHQRDKLTPQDSKDRAMDCVARQTFIHSVISLCCFNCLFLLYSTHKRLFGLINRRKD